MRAVSGIGAAIRLGLLLRRGLGDRQQHADAFDVVGSPCAGDQAAPPSIRKRVGYAIAEFGVNAVNVLTGFEYA